MESVEAAWVRQKRREFLSIVPRRFDRHGFSGGRSPGQYYTNVGIWIRSLEEAKDAMSLKSHQCHIAMRLERLLPECESNIQLLSFRSYLHENDIVDLDEIFRSIFAATFHDKLARCATMYGSSKLFAEGALANSMIRKEARDLLTAATQG